MKGSSFRRVDASTLVILMSALALATVVATGACDYHVVIGWHDWDQGRAGSGGPAGRGGGSAGSGGATGLGGGSAGSGGATGFGGGSAGSGGATGLGGSSGSGGAVAGSGGAAAASTLFLSPVTYPIGRTVGHLALGDMNGDLRPDIAVVSYPPRRPDGGAEPGPRRVDVFLSAGASEYAPAQAYAPGERPFVLAVGDIDGNGQGDLVVTDNPGVSVLLNNGGGALGPPLSLGAGHYPVGLALADLNDDGQIDIVVANASVDNRGELDLLVNLGGGMFAHGLQEMRHGNNYAMALGDLDGNGKPDIVVVNNGLDVLLNAGDGTFGPRANYAPRSNSSDSTVAIGDLNGDGAPDLAFTTYNSGSNRTSVRFNRGDGTFEASGEYVYARTSIDAIAINDVNGDGLPDLVTNWSYSALAVLLNQGAGVFGTPIRVDVSTNYFALGDLNRDGRLDIVTTTDTGIAILFGRR